MTPDKIEESLSFIKELDSEAENAQRYYMEHDNITLYHGVGKLREQYQTIVTTLTQALEIAKGDKVLVPREPTEDMYKAAHILQDDCAIKNYGGSPTPEDYWNTMIKAYEEGKR